MANARITKPIEQIGKHITERHNFVLSGGAGSGKTSSLIEVIDLIHNYNPKHGIACITFTNVAANEITQRVARKKIALQASTIHDFLWDIIKNYQKNLKQALLELIDSQAIKYNGEQVLNEEWFKVKSIEYREWKKLEEGIISHNEVLLLANKLFKDFPLLRKILRDKYDFVLIDEYQDTEEQVIQIFLNYLQEDDSPIVIGLFGDSAQAIYDKRIGKLSAYIESGIVKEVLKEDNWRCSKSVIDLINKVRSDGLEQSPSGDNAEGRATFLYSNNEQLNIGQIKSHQAFNDFNFSNHRENKELYLTHKLIARQLGFENLLNSYEYKESLTGDSPDRLIKNLLKIQEIISLYESGQYNEFIKKTDFKIIKNSDLKKLRENIEKLKNNSGETIESVLKIAQELNLIEEDDSLKKFISDHQDQYKKIKDILFVEVINLFNYRNENSPYSTQHGVKGAEFDNVFIVLDNGKWNQYNFTYLFENRSDKESIVDRTRKIFYVCCSRSKKNLVVFFQNPSGKVLDQAKVWFGAQNVLEIT
jgi:DNA helicase-2/ATP-dependent DNA helicase PcrA